MNAVVCHGPRDYRLEEVDTPVPGPEEVLVKVEACGICASDVKCYKGAEALWGGPEPYVRPPVIPGHEFIGRVVDLGERAGKYGLRPGDRAIAEQIIPCGRCRYCLSGHYWMCEVHRIFGFQGGTNDGGFAQYMRYPTGSIVHKVPEDIPAGRAALIEPLACAIHAVDRARIELDDTVVIAGMGPIGLCMLQAAKLRGPGRVVVLDVRDYRLEAASKLGADEALNPAKMDVISHVKELTGGYGCDVYIEATGHPSGPIQGLNMIRKLGRFVEFSVLAEPVTADWSIIGDRKELDIYGAHLGPYRYPTAIEYLRSKVVSADVIVTHKFKLDDFFKAFEYSEKGLDNAIKVIVIP